LCESWGYEDGSGFDGLNESSRLEAVLIDTEDSRSFGGNFLARGF